MMNSLWFTTTLIPRPAQNPGDGWYKLLTQEEGEFYNVPVPDEDADLATVKSQMRVSEIQGGAGNEMY